jgi:phage shock protein C
MRKYNKLSRDGIYRSRNGAVFGVCRGLAEYFDFSVFWARAIVIPLETDAEQEFYDSYTNSRHLAAARLKKRYENLERRIRRMEHMVTTREFEWEERLDSRE